MGLDPEFALAWAQLSVARTRLAQILDDEPLREAALTALARARTLQPDLLETELAWAVYLYRGLFEYEEALEVLEALEQTHGLNAYALELKAYLLRRLRPVPTCARNDARGTALRASKHLSGRQHHSTGNRER